MKKTKLNKKKCIRPTFSFSAILIAIVFAVACEKESINTNQIQTGRAPIHISDIEVEQYLPEIVDGRLVFESEESFDKYQKWIFENQNNPEKIHNYNHSIGFVSMKEIYDEGIASLETCDDVTNDYIQSYNNVFHATEVDNSIIQDLQAPSVIAYFANKDGVYQIDEEIIRVAYDYCYLILDGDVSMLQVIINAKEDEVNGNNIDVFPTKANEKTQIHYHTAPFDNKHRIVARLHETVANGYVYFSAETNSQEKNFLGWWIGKTLEGVWVSWPSSYYLYNGTQYNFSSSSYGSSSHQTVSALYAIMPESHYNSSF